VLLQPDIASFMFFNTYMIDCCKFHMEKLLLKANNTGLHKVTKRWHQQLIFFESQDMKSIINHSNKVFTEFA
jgi:hypothetical protein